MDYEDPTSKEQRGLDPRAFMGGRPSRSVSARKQLRCFVVALAIMLAVPVLWVMCNYLNSL